MKNMIDVRQSKHGVEISAKPIAHQIFQEKLKNEGYMFSVIQQRPIDRFRTTQIYQIYDKNCNIGWIWKEMINVKLKT